MRSILFSLLMIWAVQPCGAAVRNYLGRDSFELAPGETVHVDVLDLDLNARGAAVDTLRCTTDIKISGAGAATADAWIAAHTPEFKKEPQGLSILLQPEKTGFLGFGSLTQRRDMRLVLPLHCVPDLSTSSGKLSLFGNFPQADPLRLRSGDGRIEFSGCATSLEIRSTSGDSLIRVFQPLNRFWVRTASGAVDLSGGARDVHIETASGDISLHGLLSTTSVETVSGKVRLQWDKLSPDTTIKIRSSSGEIRLYLPPDSEPAGRVSTIEGKLQCEFSSKGDDQTLVLNGNGFPGLAAAPQPCRERSTATAVFPPTLRVSDLRSWDQPIFDYNSCRTIHAAICAGPIVCGHSIIAPMYLLLRRCLL